MYIFIFICCGGFDALYHVYGGLGGVFLQAYIKVTPKILCYIWPKLLVWLYCIDLEYIYLYVCLNNK